jgi:DNA-binding XRE family transcriptional regulator
MTAAPETIELANDAERGTHCGCSDLLGSIHRIQGQWWIVIQHTRVRLTMKPAWSELHAIRLRLGLSQIEMKNKLGMSQAAYSRLESGVKIATEGQMQQVRSLLPNAPDQRAGAKT